jgi:hypothetical protein
MLNPKEKPADVDALMENITESPYRGGYPFFHGFPFFLNRLSSASW